MQQGDLWWESHLGHLLFYDVGGRVRTRSGWNTGQDGVGASVEKPGAGRGRADFVVGRGGWEDMAAGRQQPHLVPRCLSPPGRARHGAATALFHMLSTTSNTDATQDPSLVLTMLGESTNPGQQRRVTAGLSSWPCEGSSAHGWT